MREFMFLFEGKEIDFYSKSRTTALLEIAKVFPVGHLKPSEINLKELGC